jgi:hypothetical protein
MFCGKMLIAARKTKNFGKNDLTFAKNAKEKTHPFG